MKETLFSKNAVYEALSARRRHPLRLLLAQNLSEKGRVTAILSLAKERKIPIERVPRPRLDSVTPYHQGVLLEASAYPYAGLEEMFALARRRAEAPFFLLLDSLTDPQNFGALLRTAEAVGVHGVILPLAHTVEVTPMVVNASSGASEHLLIAQANLAQTMQTLKQAGVWLAGFDQNGQEMHTLNAKRSPLAGALGLVVGSEGEGMRPLVRKACDFLLRLPMRGKIESLNAAAAGSVALYLAYLKRLESPQ